MENSELDKCQSVKASVFGRIQEEHLCPRPRLFFFTCECAMWCLWAAATAMGALAVAISLFAVSHHQYALYEATHENFFTFLVDVLPFLWFAVFGLMLLVGGYNLRHTKRGYRYPLWQIIGSSVLLSFAGGSALQMFGFGNVIDHELGEQMSMYASQEKIEQRLWQAPADGRLLGRQTNQTVEPTTIVFTDISGNGWRVDVTDLSGPELDLLGKAELVRMLGLAENEEARIFHSCGVFPWTFDAHMTRDELYEARELFLSRVKGYREQAEHHMMEMATATAAETKDGPCANMPVVRRSVRVVEVE